jgi:hypothetical protein
VKTSRNAYVKSRTTKIKTNLMEILQALTSQTRDDAMVVESLANIFASYRCRFGQSLIPVRIADASHKRSARRGVLGRPGTAWA